MPSLLPSKHLRCRRTSCNHNKNAIHNINNIERELFGLGYRAVCGIDEAGRGAWAGPLVAGCVILKKGDKTRYFDSKVLKPDQRAHLARKIKSNAISWAVGIASVEEINQSGIQSATYLAYHRAINALAIKPDFLLIDHYRLPGSDLPKLNLTFGDRLARCISAASIIAKTTRDDLMIKLAQNENLKIYGVDKNFGYGTAKHRDALKHFGTSVHHRTKYRGVLKSKQTCLLLDPKRKTR